MPTEVLALEGFSEILSNYYKEQKIGRLWTGLAARSTTREIEKVHDPVSQIVFVTTGYLRQLQDATTTADVYDHSGAAGRAHHECAEFRRALLDRSERLG